MRPRVPAHGPRGPHLRGEDPLLPGAPADQGQVPHHRGPRDGHGPGDVLQPRPRQPRPRACAGLLRLLPAVPLPRSSTCARARPRPAAAEATEKAEPGLGRPLPRQQWALVEFEKACHLPAAVPGDRLQARCRHPRQHVPPWPSTVSCCAGWGDRDFRGAPCLRCVYKLKQKHGGVVEGG